MSSFKYYLSVSFMIGLFPLSCGSVAVAQSGFAAFAKHIPAKNTELVAINRPAERLRSILENKAFVRFFEKGTFPTNLSRVGITW